MKQEERLDYNIYIMNTDKILNTFLKVWYLWQGLECEKHADIKLLDCSHVVCHRATSAMQWIYLQV